MELLETANPEKQRLIEATNQYKREIQKEVQGMSDKTERVMKNALIIGGALAVTYLLVSQLSSSKKKSKRAMANVEAADEIEHIQAPAAPSFASKVGEKLLSTASVVLLDIAKDKLAEYLRNRKSNE